MICPPVEQGGRVENRKFQLACPLLTRESASVANEEFLAHFRISPLAMFLWVISNPTALGKSVRWLLRAQPLLHFGLVDGAHRTSLFPLTEYSDVKSIVSTVPHC
ncbi:hypothetical protein NPIL_585071 [Nephila pilipes]|uniref:Uncharacterized protein n=1 Tax=Nephila pilipes TaxID=299642 RepID=A0A8X6QFL1_NEPPI|nr:hypothetical protein NPIL_585071 [Nephila pilipes]